MQMNPVPDIGHFAKGWPVFVAALEYERNLDGLSVETEEKVVPLGSCFGFNEHRQRTEQAKKTRKCTVEFNR